MVYEDPASFAHGEATFSSCDKENVGDRCLHQVWLAQPKDLENNKILAYPSACFSVPLKASENKGMKHVILARD